MSRLTKNDLRQILATNQAAPPEAQNPAIEELIEEILVSWRERDGAKRRANYRVTVERDHWRDVALDAIAKTKGLESASDVPQPRNPRVNHPKRATWPERA